MIGPTGAQGDIGPRGCAGSEGPEGPIGSAATIDVGTINPGAAGVASVTNSGTQNDAVFNFVIPADPTGSRGSTGEQSIQGIQGEIGPIGPEEPEGPIGAEGPIGPTGTQGIQGEQGITTSFSCKFKKLAAANSMSCLSVLI